MPNDAKLGLLVGLVLVVIISVVYFRKDPVSASGVEPTAPVAPAAKTPPPAPMPVPVPAPSDENLAPPPIPSPPPPAPAPKTDDTPLLPPPLPGLE